MAKYAYKLKRKKRRLRGRNKHHIVAKSRGGRTTRSNVLLLDIERHEAYHKLFGNRDLGEAVELLLRIRRIKQGQESSRGRRIS